VTSNNGAGHPDALTATTAAPPPASPNGHPSGERARRRRFMCTDLGNGERLAHRHGDDLRYCHPWKKWLC
jgi:hypothetical protein